MQVFSSKVSTTDGLWPVHLKPKEDELLSSWLVRLAAAHGSPPYNFCYLMLLDSPLLNCPDITSKEKKNTLTTFIFDVDSIDNEEVLEVLAEGTATPISKVAATTLSTYKGLFHDAVCKPQPWIMPINSTRGGKAHGLQFCPSCLLDDEEPYYRRKWRLAFVTLCEKHFIPLLDTCSHCESCITFISRKTASQYMLLTHCPSCNGDLRTAPSDTTSLRATIEELKFQEELIEVLHTGWVEVRGSGVDSHLYFKVLRMLANLLSADRTVIHRDFICEYFGLPPLKISFPIPNKRFEDLRINERRELLRLIRLLLRDLPNTFIDLWTYPVGSIHSVTASEGTKTNNIPFHIWSELYDLYIRQDYRKFYAELETRWTYNFIAATGADGYAMVYKMFTRRSNEI